MTFTNGTNSTLVVFDGLAVSTHRHGEWVRYYPRRPRPWKANKRHGYGR